MLLVGVGQGGEVTERDGSPVVPWDSRCFSEQKSPMLPAKGSSEGPFSEVSSCVSERLLPSIVSQAGGLSMAPGCSLVEQVQVCMWPPGSSPSSEPLHSGLCCPRGPRRSAE